MGMIELTHLRYFVAVAEELHFGRAAARLHMAQPPLTRQMQMLEARLQCRLLERTSRSTRLTPAGAELLQRARVLLAGAEQSLETVQRVGRGEEGVLTLATAPSFLLQSVPRLIRKFRKRYPRVEFRLHEMASSAIWQAVEAGTADLGLIRGAERSAGVESHLRWKEPMVAIVGVDHRVGERAEIGIGELRKEPFVLFPRLIGPSFHDEVMAHCRRAGFVPEVVQEARQWSSILSLVGAGMGVSVGPASVEALMPQEVNCVPLRGFRTSAQLISRKGATDPALQNFVAIARKEYMPPGGKLE